MNNTVSQDVLVPLFAPRAGVRPRFHASLLPGIVFAMDALIVMGVGAGSSWGYLGWSPDFTQEHLAVTAFAAIAVGALLYQAKLGDLQALGAWPERCRGWSC